jgi:MFS transporter, DHA1 family, inner membrane transport protein
VSPQHQLLSICFIGLTTNMMMRGFDPMLPQISSEMGVDIVVAAGLGTAFALPYALLQPFLGSLADIFGKARLIAVSSMLLLASVLLGVFAQSFTMLVVSRVLTGIAAGGIMPSALTLLGEIAGVERRQVELARFIGWALMGNVMASAFTGVIADHSNWRVALGALLVLLVVSVVTTLVALRSHIAQKGIGFNWSVLHGGYRSIFANPNAPICFGAVCIEGMLIYGLFPYLAPFFLDGRLTEAGLVILGFPLGGVVYSIILPRLMRFLTRPQMMVIGASIVGSQLVLLSFVPPWPVQCLILLVMGLGFFMLHALIQFAVTELSPTAGALAMSLHSASYFFGMALGPIVYGFALIQIGIQPTLLGVALALFLLGLFCAKFLRFKAVPARA